MFARPCPSEITNTEKVLRDELERERLEGRDKYGQRCFATVAEAHAAGFILRVSMAEKYGVPVRDLARFVGAKWITHAVQHLRDKNGYARRSKHYYRIENERAVELGLSIRRLDGRPGQQVIRQVRKMLKLAASEER